MFQEYIVSIYFRRFSFSAFTGLKESMGLESAEQRLTGLIEENRNLKDRVRDLTAKHVAEEKQSVNRHEQFQARAGGIHSFTTTHFQLSQ